MPPKRYEVRWYISIEGAATPLEAAEKAWAAMRAAGSIANSFRVHDEAGNIDTIDLKDAYGDAGRPEDDADKASSFIAFAGQIARMVKDGELDDNGDAFDMPNDDAVNSLHSLISEARTLTGIPDRPIGDQDEEEVPHV